MNAQCRLVSSLHVILIFTKFAILKVMMSSIVKTCTPDGTILIIDDDESIRQVLSLALEFEGYKVFVSSDGQKGLEILSKIQRPFLILLDLMMPVLDGWGFMAALEKDPKLASIPVVIVTAFGEKATGIGSAEVISKPVDLEHLFEVARRYSQRVKKNDSEIQ